MCAALEADIDGDDITLTRSGRPIGSLEFRSIALEGTVIDGPAQPASPTPIPDGVTVVATAMALSDTARRRLSDEFGADYIVRDVTEAPTSTDVLLTRCFEALRHQLAQQSEERLAAGERWIELGLVFPTRVGSEMDKDNARRGFRTALAMVPGLDATEWTPRELRHSFLSLLSDSGMALEEISRLVGHSGTSVTELVYRHQIRPVLQTGAVAMDVLFGTSEVGEA